MCTCMVWTGIAAAGQQRQAVSGRQDGMPSWQPMGPRRTAPNDLVEGEADVQQADVVQRDVQCLRPFLTGQEWAAVLDTDGRGGERPEQREPASSVHKRFIPKHHIGRPRSVAANMLRSAGSVESTNTCPC